MDETRLWMGLVAFCVGLVLFFNQNNIITSSYNSPPSGLKLLVLMLYQILVLVMVFGGLVMIALSWDWGGQTKTSKASR